MALAATQIVESHFEPAILVAADNAVLAFNERFSHLIGLPITAATDLKFTDVVNVDDDNARDILTDCLDGTMPMPICLPLQPRGATPCFVDCTAWGCTVVQGPAILIRLLRSDEGLAHLLEQVDASGELRRQSEARRRSDQALGVALQRLRDLEEIKDHIMAQISHDLRTPLNGILGLSEFILNEPFGPLNSLYRDYIDDLHHSGMELLQLVDKVLQLSSAAHAGMPDRKVRSELATCLDACLRVVTPMARDKGLEIIVRSALDLPVVRAEGVMVKQIFYNLLNNAIKYTQAGGTIRVDGHRLGMNYAVQIIDDGKGISEVELERIYEPFYRAGDSYISSPPGSGLGLALTKRSVELLGGQLLIESASGLGTCATVILPAEGPPTSAVTLEASPAGDQSPSKRSA